MSPCVFVINRVTGKGELTFATGLVRMFTERDGGELAMRLENWEVGGKGCPDDMIIISGV